MSKWVSNGESDANAMVHCVGGCVCFLNPAYVELSVQFVAFIL